MIEVHLHGALEALLPEPGPLRLAVSTPAEAVRACQALLPGFRAALLGGRWTVASGGERLSEGALGMRFGARKDLHILPAAEGGGTGLEWWIIAGAGLLAGAVSFALMPDLGDYGEREEADRRQSFLFRGAVNATAEGGCVPLVYGGPIRVGSVLASAAVRSERLDNRGVAYPGSPVHGTGFPGFRIPAVQWLHGAGDPAANLGAANALNMYFRTGDGTMWVKPAGGAWAKTSAYPSGRTWHAGSGRPAASLGATGEWYFQIDNFGGGPWEKTAGGWVQRPNDHPTPVSAAGAGKGGTPRPPVEADDTLQTRATVSAVDVICEGEILGLADGLASVYIDGVAMADAAGAAAVEGLTVDFERGDPDGAARRGEGFEETSSTRVVNLDVTRANRRIQAVSQPHDAARVTIEFPRLQRQIRDGDRQGDVDPVTVEFTIESRSRKGAGWSPWAMRDGGAVKLTDKSSGPAEISYRVSLEPADAGTAPAHEVRVTRTTDDRSTNDGYWDLIRWARVDWIKAVAQSYPHTALAYVTADAEKYPEGNVHRREYEIYGRIVRVPSNWSPATRAYAGLWDGAWQLAWTDNPAWCLLDLLSHPRYGLGRELGADGASLGDLEAAKWDLYALAQWCDQPVPTGRTLPGGSAETEPRWRLTCAVTKAAEAKRLLDSMLSACRAALHHGPGGLGLTFDRPEDPVLLLGDANAVEGGMRYEDGLGDRERHSAVAVSFSDPGDAYRLGTELVVDDALVAKHGYRRTDKAAFGCTSRSQAHRLGRHLLYAQEHEHETLRWRGGLDAASLRPGDVVRQTDSRRAGERLALRLRGPASGAGPWNAAVGGEGVIGRALNVNCARNSGGGLFFANPSIALPASAMADGTAATWDRMTFGNIRYPPPEPQFLSMAISGWSLGPDLAAALEPWAVIGLRKTGTDDAIWLLVNDLLPTLAEADPPTEPYVWLPRDPEAVHAFLAPQQPTAPESFVRMDFVLLDGRLRDMEDPLGDGHYAHDRLSRLRCDALPAYGAGGWRASLVLPDGTLEQRAVSRFDGRDLVLAAPLSAPPRPNAMCVLEAAGKEARLWRVASVAERGPLDHEVRAAAHDPNRYAVVEAGLNLMEPDLPDLFGRPLAAPAYVRLSEEHPSDGRGQRTVLVASVAAPEDPAAALGGGADVQIRPPNETEWRPLGGGAALRHELPNAEIGGLYRARARHFLGDGAVRSPWTESADLTVQGYATLPVPAGLEATALDGGYALEWDPAESPNYLHTQVLDGPSSAAAVSAATVRGETDGTFFVRTGLAAEAVKAWVRHVDRAGRPGAAASVTVTALDLPHPDVAAWMELSFNSDERYTFWSRSGGPSGSKLPSTGWAGIRDSTKAVQLYFDTLNEGLQTAYRNSIRAGDVILYLERGVAIRWVAWKVTGVFRGANPSRGFNLERLAFSDGGSAADDSAQTSVWFGCSAPPNPRTTAPPPAFTLAVEGLRFAPTPRIIGDFGRSRLRSDDSTNDWTVAVNITGGTPNFNISQAQWGSRASNVGLGTTRVSGHGGSDGSDGNPYPEKTFTVTVTQPADAQSTTAEYSVALERIYHAGGSAPARPASGAKLNSSGSNAPTGWSVARPTVTPAQRRYVSYRTGHRIGSGAWVMGAWSAPAVEQYKSTTVADGAAADRNGIVDNLAYDDSATDMPPSFRAGQYHFTSGGQNRDVPTWNQIKDATTVRISAIGEQPGDDYRRALGAVNTTTNNRIAFLVSGGQWVQWRVTRAEAATQSGGFTTPALAARFRFDLVRTDSEEAGGTAAPGTNKIHFRVDRPSS